jgi:hypothetical protein
MIGPIRASAATAFIEEVVFFLEGSCNSFLEPFHLLDGALLSSVLIFSFLCLGVMSSLI